MRWENPTPTAGCCRPSYEWTERKETGAPVYYEKVVIIGVSEAIVIRYTHTLVMCMYISGWRVNITTKYSEMRQASEISLYRVSGLIWFHFRREPCFCCGWIVILRLYACLYGIYSIDLKYHCCYNVTIRRPFRRVYEPAQILDIRYTSTLYMYVYSVKHRRFSPSTSTYQSSTSRDQLFSAGTWLTSFLKAEEGYLTALLIQYWFFTHYLTVMSLFSGS